MRPCWVEISTRSFEDNYRFLKSLAADDAELLAVVKSDAYGHSLALCAPAAVRAGALWLGVTSVEEGAEARALCPEARVLVMTGCFPGEGAIALEHGLTPAASSHQLRVFGAYTRRVRAGMRRVKAASSNAHLLATAFSGANGERTLVLLNRSAVSQKVAVKWRGAQFRYLETASAMEENSVEPGPRPAGASLEVLVAPGAIVTLTNVELGKAPDDLTRA